MIMHMHEIKPSHHMSCCNTLMILSAGLEKNRGLKTLRIDPDAYVDGSTPTEDQTSEEGAIVTGSISKWDLLNNVTSECIKLFVGGLSNHCITTLDVGAFFQDAPKIQQMVKLVNEQRRINGFKDILTLKWKTKTICRT